MTPVEIIRRAIDHRRRTADGRGRRRAELKCEAELWVAGTSPAIADACAAAARRIGAWLATK